MSSISATTLAVSSNATLTGPIALTGATTANNISMPTGNFSQGTGTFSTGSGTNYLNGPIIANSPATFNSTISVQSGIVSNGQISSNGTLIVGAGGYIKLPSAQILGGSIVLVDTTTSQSISGAKSFTTSIQLPSSKTITASNDVVDTTSIQSIGGTKTFTATLITPKGTNLTTTNDCVDTTNAQTIAGVKTFSGSIVANAGVNAGANALVCGTLTSSGLISLNAGSGISLLSDATNRYKTTIYSGTDTNSYYDNVQTGGSHIFRNIVVGPTNVFSINATNITATSVINANAGLTIPSGQTLTVNGTFAPSSITTAGLITANGGLTIPSGQTLTVASGATLSVLGTFTPSSMTTSGLITANGGLTMGANQNITLATTFTTPTSLQLGYTVNTIGTAPQTIGNGTLTTICSMTVPAGVWNFYYGMTDLQALSSTTAWNMSNTQMGLSTSGLAMSVGSMFWNSLYSTKDTRSFPAGVTSSCNLYQNYIATFTASTTIYLLVNITSNTTLQVYSGGIIRATRIA